MGMRAPRALIAVCVAALVAVAAACALWVTDTARSSIREQFVAREETAATERAAQVADAVAGGKATTALVTSAAPEHSGRISASAPVPGHAWTVVITAPESAPDAPAAALGRRLLAGFAVTFVIGAGLLAGIAAAAVRSR